MSTDKLYLFRKDTDASAAMRGYQHQVCGAPAAEQPARLAVLRTGAVLLDLIPDKLGKYTPASARRPAVTGLTAVGAANMPVRAAAQELPTPVKKVEDIPKKVEVKRRRPRLQMFNISRCLL